MPTDKELLIKDLMHKCDCLYRENSRLKEMVSTQPLKAADKEVYEALLSDKDADAQDRWLDFEGFDMLPQEAEAAEEAEKELKATREAIIARKKRGSSILRENPFRRILSVRWSIYIPKGIIRRVDAPSRRGSDRDPYARAREVLYPQDSAPYSQTEGYKRVQDRPASRHANSKELCLCLIAGRHDDREICGSHTVPQATGTVQTCGGTSPRVNGQRLVQGCGGFAKAPLLPIMGAGDAD